MVDNAVVGQTIVLTSTTYVGCTRELLVKPLQDRGFEVGQDVFVAFSPERIDPGVEAHAPDPHPGSSAVSRRRAPRGPPTCCSTPRARMHSVSSPEAAEMTKLLENTFRAVNIALANEFSDAAKELSVDVIEVIERGGHQALRLHAVLSRSRAWAGTASRAIRTTCSGNCGRDDSTRR